MPSAVSARALLRGLVAAAALAVPAAAAADAPQGAGGAALRERLGRFGLVTNEPSTGTPRAVAKLNGFLTGPSGRPGSDVALDYVRDHPGVFRLDHGDVDALRLADRTRSGGVEHLTWEQRFRGIPSADTQLEAAVTASGRLMTVTGAPAADLAVESIEPSVSAERAYAAVRDASIAVDRRAGGAERATGFADGGSASLVLYQDGDGTRLGWRVLAPVSSTEVYDAIVNARSGTVVRRHNLVKFANEGLVFESNPRDSAQLSKPFDQWLTPGAATLTGPNVHAFVDTGDTFNFGSVTPPAEVTDWTNPLSTDLPPGATCPTVACSWDPADVPGSWQEDASQSATQLFYFVNRFHDHLEDPPISFNGFEGDDEVLAQAMDGAAILDEDHRNNASFLTLPEGRSPHLEVDLFSSEDGSPYGNYDGANDASVIFHEYTHGLSQRLVTDPQGFGALNSAQAGAIGEGTSDFYALDYLDEQNLIADDVRLGSYLDGGVPEGLRYQAIDCDRTSPAVECPGTPRTDDGGFGYEDFGKVFDGPEVHSDGEIWAQTLWDLRERMITDHGAVVGIHRTRELVTSAMRDHSPTEPSFLDMRNAILQASTEDDAAIWDVFANRGMGYFASTDGGTDVAPHADANTPPAPGSEGLLQGTVRDDDGLPVGGAHVGIAGHDTQGRGGLGPLLADDTATSGAYAITAPAGTYELVIARHGGFREDRNDAPAIITNGQDPALDFTLVRDWSSPTNGASIERFTGPDNTSSGCGPGGLIDDRHDSVWGSNSDEGGQTIVIDLGTPIDAAGVAIDPGAGCFDDDTAGLREYEVQGSTGPDGDFRALGLPGAFPKDQGGALRDLIPNASALRVRYVKLHAKTPQSEDGDGKDFLDVAELHVARQPGSPLGPAADTGGVQGVSATAAALTGTVNPHGGTTQVLFEYGPTTEYGAGVPAQSVGGDAPVAVGAVATGLQPLTRYHFRVVAVRAGVPYPGSDSSFVTGAAPSSPQPQPQPQPPPVARVTALNDSKLKANRRGFFKVKALFGDTAPAGNARFTVRSRKGMRLARASTPVRQGLTVTKTLRLSRRGRRAIRPGQSKKVTLELRLPNGETLKKRLKLSRARR